MIPTKRLHQWAASVIRKILEEGASEELYLPYASAFSLPQIYTKEDWSHRFHFHMQEAGRQLSEQQFLQVRKEDRPTTKPFLPIDIYLDNLRSAHNVGSILRTNEAFRIGEVYFGGYTPYGPKMNKTSMGAEKFVTCHPNATLDDLKKRPLIALETVEGAINFNDYLFPPTFSLLLGNEELGLSTESLKMADVVLQIPLVGSKNSLNVASAFSIIAAKISASLHT